LTTIVTFTKGSPKVSRCIRIFVLAILPLGLMATRARADITVSLQDVSLAPGGIGTMNIYASSTSGDTLSQFGLELLITPVSSPSFLYFSSGMDQPTADFGNPSPGYVFEGQSSSMDIPLPFWGGPFDPGTNYPNDTIAGGDSADANAGSGYVTLTGTYLLATVQFDAPVGASGTFQVSLAPSTYDATMTGFTYFQDMSDNFLNYSSSGGLVTISSVPEPSSLVLGAMASLGGLFSCWSRRRPTR
jgi:hypothetical protein